MMQEMRLMQIILWLLVHKSQTIAAHQRHAPPPALPAVCLPVPAAFCPPPGLEREQEEALFSYC